MEVKPYIKTSVFLIWIMLVPAGTWFIYKTYPPSLSGQCIKILAFLLLICVVMLICRLLLMRCLFFYQIKQSLNLENSQQKEMITASIGVATAPEMRRTHLHSFVMPQRALYVGAKRTSRNRWRSIRRVKKGVAKLVITTTVTPFLWGYL
jgi:hypothetical protein